MNPTEKPNEVLRRKKLSRKQDDIRVRNIPKNIARANREYAKEHKITEAPEKVKRYHEKMFRGAEQERERGK